MSKFSVVDKISMDEPEAQLATCPSPVLETDPRIEALVTEMIGRIADKWTMVILEVLEEYGEMRFTRLGEMAKGISQKMLAKTVRQMERDGLLTRTVYAVVPPKVEYKLTELGLSLSAAFCGVWIWAEQHYDQVEQTRQKYDESLATH